MAGSSADTQDSSDSVADGDRGVAGGIASEVNSISASGNCSANSSTVCGRSCGCRTTSPAAPRRSAAMHAESSRASAQLPGSRAEVGEADVRLAVVGRELRCAASARPAQRCTAPSVSVAVARGPPTCTSAERPHCVRPHRRRRRRHRWSARSPGRARRAGSPRSRRRDTTVRRRARPSACWSAARQICDRSFGLRRCREVWWSTIRRWAAGKFCNQHALTCSCRCPRNGRPLPEL